MAISGVWTMDGDETQRMSGADLASQIVHVALTELHSGPQRTLYELASRSAAKGYAVDVVLSSGSALDLLAERLRYADVNVHRVGHPTDMLRGRMQDFTEFRALFRRLGPRLAHFHVPRVPCAWEAILAARAAGVPNTIRTEHDLIPDPRRPREAVKIQLVDAALDHVVFTSRAVAEAHRASGREGLRSWSIIPNGLVHEPVERSDRLLARATLGLPPDAPVAVMIGYLDEKDGVLDFLRAAAASVYKGSALHFLAVGDGPLLEVSKRLARDLGIASRVRFAGVELDVCQVLPACDIFVHPGHGPDMPGALPEALAAGLPVVTTPVEGLEDFLLHRTGVPVCPAGDPNALARGMLAFERDAELRRCFVEQVQPHVLSVLSSEVMHERYEDLYRRLGAFPSWTEPPDTAQSETIVGGAL